MKFLRDEKGQMLVLTVLSTTILFGFLAFAVDAGLMFRAKCNLQIAADAAATSGALALHYGSSSTNAYTDAYCAAYANGYKGSNVSYTCNNAVATNATSALVYFNTPPTYGYHTSAGYFEAILTESNPTVFANMLGIHSLSISARAVAGTAASSKNCGYLDGSSSIGPTLYMKGSGTITTSSGNPSCDLYVAATGSNAINLADGGVNPNVAELNVAGTGSSFRNTLPDGNSINYSAPPQSNPFGDIVTNGEPSPYGSPSPCTKTIAGNSYTNQTLSVAAGSVVCFTGTNVDLSGTTLSGGKLGDAGSTFVFENGVAVSQSGPTTITDGTLDVYNGVYNQAPNALFTITAPQTQTIPPQTGDTPAWNNGIAILVPTTNTTYTQYACPKNKNQASDSQVLYMQFGSGSIQLTGYIYAPNATIYTHDQGGGIVASGFVSASLCLDSSTLMLPPYGSLFPYDNPLTTVSLVE